MHPDHGLRGTVAVIGDVMLDSYIIGEASRISPEAPVPVVEVRERRDTLGGAGNVALNLALLGCSVRLLGVVGADLAGARVTSIIGAHDIGNCLVVDKDLPTTTKTRVVANRQQLVRFDEELRINGTNGCYGKLAETVLELIGGSDLVLLSDYNKGVLFGDLVRKVIRYCRGLKLPVLVDPKRGDWKLYAGATLIKPNIHELREATGKNADSHDEILGSARQMMANYKIDAVLVTMGARGMLLVTDSQQEYIPAQAREVFDVSGAGDTVIATLAACMCEGKSLSESARIANVAAGIVVGKLGTSPIDRKELEASL